MDELQSLKELYPEPTPPVGPVVQRHRESLMTMIEEATDATPSREDLRRRGRRRSKLLLIPAATVVLAAAGWAVLRDEATEAAAFACVADGVVSVLPNDGTSPTDACRSQWEAGRMQAGVTAAPPLVACVNARGSVEVIQAEPRACDSAGMREWTGEAAFETIGSAVRSSLTSFHDRFEATGNGCATEHDWRTALEDRLQHLSSRWSLDVQQIEADRRCFHVGAIDPTTMTITLTGVPGNHSIGCDPRTGC